MTTATPAVNDKVIYVGTDTKRRWNGVVLAVDEVTGKLAIRWTSFGPGKSVVQFQTQKPELVAIGQHEEKNLEKKAAPVEAKATPAPKAAAKK